MRNRASDRDQNPKHSTDRSVLAPVLIARKFDTVSMGSADDRTCNGGEEIVKLKESLKLDSRERSAHREAVARDKKVLSREEEEIKLEQQGCEKMAHLEAVREGLALEEVADAANIAASATDPAQDNPALLAASTKLDYGERLARRAVVREGLARGKIDFLREEARTRLEEEGKAEEDAASVDAANVAASASDSDQGIPSLLAAQTASFFSSLTQTVSTSLDAGEKRPRREAVREGLPRGKQDLSREEERIRLEAQVKAKNECKKKKREEESRMRDDKRKQKMDKNTKPKDKGKGKKYFGHIDISVTSAALVVSVTLLLHRGNPRFSQLSSTVSGLFLAYNLCRKVSKEKSSEQLNNVYELEEDGQFPSVVKSMDSWPCGNIGFILRYN
ncbi:hypothetical protein YC2023_051954 [Brassica napus]